VLSIAGIPYHSGDTEFLSKQWLYYPLPRQRHGQFLIQHT